MVHKVVLVIETLQYHFLEVYLVTGVNYCFQVLMIVVGVSWGQNLDQYSITIPVDQRQVLIGHLNQTQLETVFLTRRQKLAWREEKYLRSLGYLPFSQESDSLLINKDITEQTVIENDSDNEIADKESEKGFSLQATFDSSKEQASFTQSSQTSIGGENINKIQHQNRNKNTQSQLEEILNNLSFSQQQKFLNRFSILNPSQQRYAYNQFLSNPLNVQQFAIKQFLELDPEVLKISINEEIEQEKNEKALIINHKTNSLKGIDQSRYQTNFDNSFFPFQPNQNIY